MKLKIIVSLIMLSSVLLVTPVFAEDSSIDNSASTQTTTTATSTPKRIEVKEKLQDRVQTIKKNTKERIENQKEKTQTLRENTKAKLDEAKLKICQARENAINKRKDQLTNLVTNILTKFSNIMARVEQYYTDKLVPQGKTLSNYDELVADVVAKKEAVNTALSTAQNSSFSCDSDDPKGQLTTYRENMQNVKTALSDYRTSIKNLIVAVKGLVSESSADSAEQE